MKQSISLIRSVQIGKTPSFLGSDWHFRRPDINPDNAPVKIAQRIIDEADKEETGERHFYCPGDVYDVPDATSESSALVQEFLDHISQRFDAVFFVPGNHDLRGRDRPYENFSNLATNVKTPSSSEQVLSITIPTTNAEVRVLLCNVLPGGTLLLPKEILDVYGIGERSVEDLAQEHPDNNLAKGPLLHVSTEERKKLMEKAIEAINPQTNVIAVHGLPDPAPIEIPVTPDLLPAIDRVRSTIDDLGIRLLTDPQRLEKIFEENSKIDSSISLHRIMQIWVGKAASDLGIPLLRMAGDRIGEGLIAMHGHNHCAPYERMINLNGTHIKLLSHQQVIRS